MNISAGFTVLPSVSPRRYAVPRIFRREFCGGTARRVRVPDPTRRSRESRLIRRFKCRETSPSDRRRQRRWWRREGLSSIFHRVSAYPILHISGRSAGRVATRNLFNSIAYLASARARVSIIPLHAYFAREGCNPPLPMRSRASKQTSATNPRDSARIVRVFVRCSHALFPRPRFRDRDVPSTPSRPLARLCAPARGPCPAGSAWVNRSIIARNANEDGKGRPIRRHSRARCFDFAKRSIESGGRR